jgi:hypothetical protein
MNIETIIDNRGIKDFSKTSFSGFKKNEVKRDLITSLYQSQLEEACFWSADLVCSGHFEDLWDIIIYFFAKYIHIGNSILAVYIDKRLDIFKSIINECTGDILGLRNDRTVRELFAEIIVVLCDSERSIQYSEIVISTDDFNMSYEMDRFVAPSMEFTQVLLPSDPEEFVIAVNELSYSLYSSKRSTAWYWIEWIMVFDANMRKRKHPCVCAPRVSAPVPSKFQTDVVWLIWDVFVNRSHIFSKTVQTIILSCVHLYALKYKKSNSQFDRRRFIIYFVAELLTTDIIPNEEIVHDKQRVQRIKSNIHVTYNQIKNSDVEAFLGGEKNNGIAVKNINITKIDSNYN